MTSPTPLNIMVIGAGLAGLSAALGLRRHGHHVTIYDKSDFASEVGAGLGVMPNAARILEGMMGFDMLRQSRPYSQKWSCGTMPPAKLCRDPMLETTRANLVTDEEGQGLPCKVLTKHRLTALDPATGTCTFENGSVVTGDLIVGADGIQSRIRACIGVEVQSQPASRSSYRMVIPLAKLQQINMAHILESKILNFWPGPTPSHRVIAGASHGGQVLSLYATYPADSSCQRNDDYWQTPATAEQVCETYPDIDPRMHDVFRQGEDLHIWRLVNHKPYPYWHKGKAVLIGDAAHPMFPDQNQGFSQAVEDAGALSLIFSPEYTDVLNGDIELGLRLFEQVRKERATKVQSASLAASKDFRARFGFKHPEDPPDKLSLEWLCDYQIEKHVAEAMANVKNSR